MNLNDCYNFEDFRKLAKKNLPAPIFHYIDGGSDDETTLKRNTESFLKCDLVPNILASVGEPDLSTEVFGQKIDLPIFLSPTAMQRLYHHDGDKASARAAEKFDTFYSMSTMATSSIEEVSNISGGLTLDVFKNGTTTAPKKDIIFHTIILCIIIGRFCKQTGLRKKILEIEYVIDQYLNTLDVSLKNDILIMIKLLELNRILFKKNNT